MPRPNEKEIVRTKQYYFSCLGRVLDSWAWNIGYEGLRD